MQKFIFISRHAPTDEQVERARQASLTLIPAGDLDAFAVTGEQIATLVREHDAQGIACVHQLVAMHALAAGLPVATFENVNRAPVGEKPVFGCGRVVVTYPGGITNDTFGVPMRFETF